MSLYEKIVSQFRKCKHPWNFDWRIIFPKATSNISKHLKSAAKNFVRSKREMKRFSVFFQSGFIQTAIRIPFSVISRFWRSSQHQIITLMAATMVRFWNWVKIQDHFLSSSLFLKAADLFPSGQRMYIYILSGFFLGDLDLEIYGSVQLGWGDS